MNDLLQGVQPAQLGSKTQTQRIAPLIRNEIAKTRNDNQWAVHNLPSIGSMGIVSPPDVSSVRIQYVFHWTMAGWGLWRDVPIDAMNEWSGNIYFGSPSLKVYIIYV